MPKMDLTIEHIADRRRFQAIVEGRPCVVDYHLSNGVLTILHTGVPPALEGRGIAGELTRAVLDHVRAHGLKVEPACSYARSYIDRHPENRDLLA